MVIKIKDKKGSKRPVSKLRKVQSGNGSGAMRKSQSFSTDVKFEDILKNSNIKTKVVSYLKPNDTIIINMTMNNGDRRTFIQDLKGESFEYQGGTYVFDNELKYYNSSLKSYCLDYHQSLSFPYRQNIDVSKIKEGVEALGEDTMINSINPNILNSAMNSKIVSDIVSGASFEEALKLFKIMLIIIAIVTVLHFGLFLKASGILDGLNMPF